MDKEAVQKKSELYKGDNRSPRWQSLTREIEEKKSALQVEGKTSEDRATEFAKLNYLLAYKAEDMINQGGHMLPEAENKPESYNQNFSELELEALALELELELLQLN
ncbi:MAG: hypothetical protein NTW49_08720 [Bacteroidia bacterium]|nr:hypothetical protein [Bacteroidia bacterium]